MYIDSAILSGFILNFLCLDITACVTGVKSKKTKMAAGAAVMSCLSVVCLFWVHIKLVYLLTYPFLIRIVYGKCSVAELIRRTVVCMGVCLLFSALMITVIPSDKMWILTSGGGNFFVPEDIYFYIPLAVVYMAVKVIVLLISVQKKIYPVSITVNGSTVNTFAMIDTGNSLTDPESGSPVVIVEQNLFDDMGEHFKIIPYKNISSSAHYTKIYPVEQLCFTEEHRVYKNIYAVFVNKPLNSHYHILLHNSFIERK